MKKIILLLAAPFIFFTAQADTITQPEADSIALERLSQETRPYTVYAKEGVQQKMTITSIEGEVLEVNYKFWVYYIDYNNNAGRYLFVKESNGNLLEVKVNSEAKPEDLAAWRVVELTEVPFTELLWEECSCWVNQRRYPLLLNRYRIIIINSDYELKTCIGCLDLDPNSYPEIDFSKHSLLLVSGLSGNAITNISKSLRQFSTNYVLNVEITTLENVNHAEQLFITLITNKLSEDSDIELKVTTSYDNEERPVLSEVEKGIYVETCPVKGRTKINFIDNERLEIIKGKSSDEFYYEIQGYRIKLLPYGGFETDFHILDYRKFEIGNLYGGPQDGAPGFSIMIFEKED